MTTIYNAFPVKKRRNPGWLVRFARSVREIRFLLNDYGHFRDQGMTCKAAWWNARNTPTVRKVSP